MLLGEHFTKTSELKWRTITKANLEPLPALHFPMVVPVFHKGQKSVLRAVQQMYVWLKKQGFPLFRVHTDRGREFINKEMRSYLLARDVYHTSTPADLPQANGLVERFIGILKSQARAALYQSGLGEAHWPSAMRHVGGTPPAKVAWPSTSSPVPGTSGRAHPPVRHQQLAPPPPHSSC